MHFSLIKVCMVKLNFYAFFTKKKKKNASIYGICRNTHTFQLVETLCVSLKQ